MNQNEVNDELLLLYGQECETIDLKSEYGKEYTGTEKYGIITSLTEEKLNKKYEPIISRLKPYIILPPQYSSIREEYRKNDKKHVMRIYRGSCYPLDEVCEYHHPELIKEDLETEFFAGQCNEHLYKAIQRLNGVQKRRVIQMFFLKMTKREIAHLESVNHSTIDRSVCYALKKLKKYLIEDTQFSFMVGMNEEDSEE